VFEEEIKIEGSEGVDEEQDSSYYGYLRSPVICLFIVLVAKWKWPESIPFDFWEFWESKGDIIVWIRAGAPLFLWAFVFFSLFLFFVTKTAKNKNIDLTYLPNAEIFKKEFFKIITKNFFAGVLFRWLAFLAAMVVLQFGDYLSDLVWGGIFEKAQSNLASHVVNYLTLGFLKGYIFHEAGWFVGAALLVANTLSISNDNKDYRFYRYINRWFVGFFLFWVMFNYGLGASIFVHIIYEIIISGYCCLFMAVYDGGKK
jgi:hypothetical protein